MKPLITINLKLKRALSDEVEDVGVITISQLGTIEVTLDRDEMGKVFVSESVVIPSESFTLVLEQAKACLNDLHHKMVTSEIACRRVQSSMFELERYLSDASEPPVKG